MRKKFILFCGTLFCAIYTAGNLLHSMEIPSEVPAEFGGQVAPAVITPVEVPAPSVSVPEVSPTGEPVPVVPELTPGVPTETPGTLEIPAVAPTDLAAVPEPSKASAKEQKTGDETKDIYLNFENTDLANFINYIAELKKLNLILDKSIEGAKISLTIREPLSVEGAWNVFLTILETAGFSIVKTGDVHKIIPKDKKVAQPLPIYINVSPDKLPESDLSIRYLMFFNNLQAPNVMDLLKSMLSDKSDAKDIKEVNGILITDKSLNIRSAAKILLELDQMGTAEMVSVIPLRNANAKDVQDLLKELIKKPETNPLARLLGRAASEGTAEYFPTGTKIIAEERTNSLILLGAPKPLKKIEDFIKNYIDTELKATKSPLRIYPLQHTNAKQIREILSEVIQAKTEAGNLASKYGAIRGGVKYFKPMTFQVDEDGNKLVVSCVDDVDWKLLKKTIEDLDKPQPQVAIETLIAMVDVTDDKLMGGAVRNKFHGQIGKNIDFQSAANKNGPTLESIDSKPASLLGNLLMQISLEQGLSTLTFGKNEGNIWAIFNMLKTQTNTTVLSQPFLTIVNKKEASVIVGNTRRVPSEQDQDGKTTGWAEVEANTKLTLKPQINLDGVIRMEINVEIAGFAGTGDGTQKNTRKLNTDVTVANGQVIVLGGFVKTQVSEGLRKTPFLGDIPILGWFFKSQRRTITKQYIFMFLSPTIIKPRELPGMNLYTKMKLHDATDYIEESVQTKQIPDPLHNWFFNSEKENYSHKVIDFANARYQPTTVDIKNDPLYMSQTERQKKAGKLKGQEEPSEEKKPPEIIKFTETGLGAKEFEEKIKTQETALKEKREKLKDILETPKIPKGQVQIEAKREDLKELISTVPDVTQPVKTQNVEEMREQLKELIAPPVSTPMAMETSALPQPVALGAPPVIDSQPLEMGPVPPVPTPMVLEQTRNKLKEYLANNPAFARMRGV